MDIEHVGLQIYLLSSLRLPPKAERLFRPGNVKFARSLVGSVKYEPGDIAVRRSPPTQPEGQRIAVFPVTWDTTCRCNRSELSGGFTRMTVESTEQPDASAPPQTLTLKGFKCTLQSDFAPENSLEIIADSELDFWLPYSPESAIALLRSGAKGCVINGRCVCVTDASGVSTYFVLSGHLRVQVRSFGFSDIIGSLGKISAANQFDAESLSLWRPLMHFWMEESFRFRAMAQQVYEHSKSEETHEAAKVHGVIRTMVTGMIRVRQAICDSIVDQFLSVATELQVSHEALQKMLRLKLHVDRLMEIESGPPLTVSFLDRFAEFDLQTVLPVSEGEFEQLLADLGPDFTSKLRPRFQATPDASTLIRSGYTTHGDPLSKIGHYIWLTALQMSISNVHQKMGKVQVTDAMEHINKLGRGRQMLVLRPNQASRGVGGYRAVLFHGMPKYYDFRSITGGEVSEFESDAVDKLKSVLSRCNGFIIKSQKLLSWVSSCRISIPTTVWFAELDRLQNLLLGASDRNGGPSEPWMQSRESKFKFFERKCVDLVSSTAYILYIADPDLESDIYTLLRVMRFSPVWEERDYRLSEDPLEDSNFEGGCESNNPYHFALSYSAKFAIFFFALVRSHCDVGDRRLEHTLCITLTAVSVPEFAEDCTQTLSSTARTFFDLQHLPSELCYSWELPVLCQQQGLTTNTSNLPYSPLRWCTTRLNDYCVWLLSPYSHIIFGFSRDRFVQVSMRIAHRPLSPTIRYVLPVFSADRFGGMVGLFEGRRHWDAAQKREMVGVYQLKLKRY